MLSGAKGYSTIGILITYLEERLDEERLKLQLVKKQQTHYPGWG
jgi:hypothetical protein